MYMSYMYMYMYIYMHAYSFAEGVKRVPNEAVSQKTISGELQDACSQPTHRSSSSSVAISSSSRGMLNSYM